jgi:hypothetical protein
LTYVRFQTDGGAMVRRLSPAPSRDPRAEYICAAAQTGQVQNVENLTEPAETPTPQP